MRLAQVAALGEGWERSSQSSLKLDKLVGELSKCKDKESADAKTIEARRAPHVSSSVHCALKRGSLCSQYVSSSMSSHALPSRSASGTAQKNVSSST